MLISFALELLAKIGGASDTCNTSWLGTNSFILESSSVVFSYPLSSTQSDEPVPPVDLVNQAARRWKVYLT